MAINNNKKYCRCTICDTSNLEDPDLRFVKDKWGSGFLCGNCVDIIKDTLSEFGLQEDDKGELTSPVYTQPETTERPVRSNLELWEAIEQEGEGYDD